MKKLKSEMDDWGRASYKRADLGPIVRGKYVKRIAVVYKGTKTPKRVVLKPA